MPGGTFTMGTDNPKYSDFYGSNQHPHQVTVSSFYMEKFLVTIGQMNIFKEMHNGEINNRPSGPHSLWSYRSPEDVNYFQAASFCAWLANKTGLPFKLPTEAQWMYAATDKGTMVYPT
ncbi:formylglycine-generating enzyme family protein, partial [Piscirickettsia litoralis]|uniref:formylglycine-generating enzyme family protein n=1 Tax=Piscirickettsia litoralis TaxID=1891921 RepID=UPI0022862FCF